MKPKANKTKIRRQLKKAERINATLDGKRVIRLVKLGRTFSVIGGARSLFACATGRREAQAIYHAHRLANDPAYRAAIDEQRERQRRGLNLAA